MIIDLRSDTVTRPGKDMLDFMTSSPVGDMVLGEDPMVNELEKKAAEMFGMEGSVFCPSGTMTNQIAVKVHTNPGDDVICSKPAHIYQYEGGGIAFHSAASVTLIESSFGLFTAGDVLSSIQPDDPHKPATSLVSAENTVNMGGGKTWDISELRKISDVCRDKGLAFHLDGARLFNALVKNNENPLHYGEIFDTISICLSKGLGAPVGSLLIGNSEHIKRATRLRKVMGGTMRQAGYIAAAGVYALENNIARLDDDHRNASLVADALNDVSWVEKLFPAETNIIIFRTKDNVPSARIVSELHKQGILVLDLGNNHIRMVTHMDVSREMTLRVAEAVRNIKI